MKYLFLVCLFSLMPMVHGNRHPLAELHRAARGVQCADFRTLCPDNTTCCRVPSREFGCCPLPNAVCCSSGTHCCPSGYTCGETYCRK